MVNRTVTYARLQTEAYVVGAGGLGTVFPPMGKTFESLNMQTTDLGLNISFLYKGLRKELLIPYGNVVLMELEPESKKNESKKS